MQPGAPAASCKAGWLSRAACTGLQAILPAVLDSGPRPAVPCAAVHSIYNLSSFVFCVAGPVECSDTGISQIPLPPSSCTPLLLSVPPTPAPRIPHTRASVLLPCNKRAAGCAAEKEKDERGAAHMPRAAALWDHPSAFPAPLAQRAFPALLIRALRASRWDAVGGSHRCQVQVE